MNPHSLVNTLVISKLHQYIDQWFIISGLVCHSELRVLWKHTCQHPNYLKATPIYRLLVWIPIWCYTCFGNKVANILIVSKLHPYITYKFNLPFGVMHVLFLFLFETEGQHASASWACFGNIVVNILVISKLHQYKNYMFCLPFQVTGCI